MLGRSMVNVARTASELGYLSIPDGILVSEEELNRHDDSRMVLLTTGSQGEPMAALSRMAMGSHRSVSIKRGDTVIISASPIPGNEKSVGTNINRLFKLGAEVIYEAVSGVHVSGHASQEELKLMLNLTRPKCFVPIHGSTGISSSMPGLRERSVYRKTGYLFLRSDLYLSLIRNQAESRAKCPEAG